MTNDFTISSMYLFIHQYNDGGEYNAWTKEADKAFGNGDGILIKSEFEKWVAEELPMWNGLSSKDARDTLDEFWYGLDINRSAKHIEGTRLNNLHALDDKEMERMERIIQEMEDYNELLTTLEGPENLNQSNRIRWVEKVKAELKKSLDEWIRGGGDDGYDVMRAYEQIVIEITPEITIDDMQIDYSKIFAKYGFDLTKSSDKQALLPLIKDFLNGQQTIIANHEKGLEFGTVDRIESFIEQYISEALYDNETEFYNNKPFIDGFTKGDINVNFPGKSDFQKQVAACDLRDDLVEDEDWAPLIETFNLEESEDKFRLVELLREYVDKELDTNSSQFLDIRNNILNLFKNNNDVQKAGIQTYFDKMISNTEAQRVIKNDLDAAISQGKGEPGTSSEYILSDYCKDFRADTEKMLLNGVSNVSANIKTDIIEALLGAEFDPNALAEGWDVIDLGILDLNQSKKFVCKFNMDPSIPVEIIYDCSSTYGQVVNKGDGSFTLLAPGLPGEGTVTLIAKVGDEEFTNELTFTVVAKEVKEDDISYNTGKLHSGTNNNTNHNGGWQRGKDAQEKVKANVKSYINNTILSDLKQTGKYDEDALETVAKMTFEYFEKIIDGITIYSSTLSGMKTIDGEDKGDYYLYAAYNYKKIEDKTTGDIRCKIDLSTKEGWYLIEVEKSAIVEKFSEFYKEEFAEK